MNGLTEEQKRQLEISRAIDMLFEDIVQGRPVWYKGKKKHALVLREAILKGEINPKHLRDWLNMRIDHRLPTRSGSGYTQDVKNSYIKRIESILDIISAEIEEVPLHVSDDCRAVQDIAQKRLEAGT